MNKTELLDILEQETSFRDYLYEEMERTDLQKWKQSIQIVIESVNKRIKELLIQYHSNE
jgi:hypothetical protein